VRLDLTWTEAEVNGEGSPTLFELETPRGARVVEVGAGNIPPAELFRGTEPPPDHQDHGASRSD
jgi:hypothetical protein